MRRLAADRCRSASSTDVLPSCWTVAVDFRAVGRDMYGFQNKLMFAFTLKKKKKTPSASWLSLSASDSVLNTFRWAWKDWSDKQTHRKAMECALSTQLHKALYLLSFINGPVYREAVSWSVSDLRHVACNRILHVTSTSSAPWPVLRIMCTVRRSHFTER